MSFGGPSAALGTVAQKFMMEDAQKHQIQILKNQKQWLYDDLRAAGINPILAGHMGQVAGGAGAPSVSTSGDGTGAELRAGRLQKAAMAKLKAEAGTARAVEGMQKDVALRVWSEGQRAASEAGTAANENVLKAIEARISTAGEANRLTGIRERRKLDQAGAMGVEGSMLRQLNAILRMLRGRDSTSANE